MTGDPQVTTMLRITTERRGETIRLGLHGVLGGPWVSLLDGHWQTLVKAQPSTKVTVVLSEVEFIDPDGERLLAEMAERGVEFVVTGSMNRYVIEKLQSKVNHVSAE
jgi:hypothetical protein